MSISTTVTRACLAAAVMAVSLHGWGATRFNVNNFAVGAVPEVVIQPLGSIAPIVLADSDLSKGPVKAYRPWFEDGSWQGDIVEYIVSKDDGLKTSVSFSATSPANTKSPGDVGYTWSALVQFKKAETASASYWDTGRKIITWNGGQKALRWTDATIGVANRTLIDKAAVTAGAATSKVLNWVRGERVNEFPAVAALRTRISLLGDIIHSKPVYVGAPNDGHTDNDYATWAAGKINRAPRVYVGANDGMLHVFDAVTGNEVYAYVPSMLMGNLPNLVARPFTHTYFVDGESTVRDAYFDDAWHTVLVGTLGAGGKGFFALDVTNPNLSTEASNTGNDKKVLWEKSAVGDNDLGDSFSRAVIAKLNDDEWYAVVGNGYNSVNGVAMLYAVNLETGAVTKKVSTASGSAGSPNGLSSPSLLDTNKDGKADYAYAGDIDGNLWKFDLTSTNPASWAVAYTGKPLHPTQSAGLQPILTAPQIAPHPSQGYILYFGTGRLLIPTDIEATSLNALYGIWDKGTAPPTKLTQNLQAQTWSGPKTYTSGAQTETIAIYNPDAGDVDWASKHGWKIAFPAGLRVLQPVQVRANRVKATVHGPAQPNPDLADTAHPTIRQNWALEAVLTDGGPHPTTIYDLNADGVLNDSDRYDNDPTLGVEWHVPMVWKQRTGIMSQVTIARIANGVDTLFLNYLEPPYPEPCTIDCPDGFQGGHIDVDTWLDSVALAGGSTKHDHEYDKKVGRVFVDFFDLNVPKTAGTLTPNRADVTGQVEIDSTGVPAPSSTIANTTEFIVLVTNADFSPGSTLTIGKKQWNVVEYQRQLHEALRNWDATVAGTTPKDANGASLVFTWKGIKDAGGTIEHSFNDSSILAGGLHPTQTGCVKDSAYNKLFTSNVANGTTTLVLPNVGRWRNGALTTQLIKKSFFTANPAISQLLVQKPSDLTPVVTLQNGQQVALTKDYNSDGDTNDPYEKIGGLIAPLTAAGATNHIYESTLFWHFGDLANLLLKVKPCYGDAKWAEAAALEQSNDPIAAALAALGVDENLTLDEAVVEYKKCSGVKGSACANVYKILLELVKLADDYEVVENPGEDSPTDGSTPVIMGGGVEDTGVTTGPEFDYGRMSWTDLVN